MKYGRILLKLSGEALSGEQGTGICPEVLSTISAEIKDLIEAGVDAALIYECMEDDDSQ